MGRFLEGPGLVSHGSTKKDRKTKEFCHKFPRIVGKILQDVVRKGDHGPLTRLVLLIVLP